MHLFTIHVFVDDGVHSSTDDAFLRLMCIWTLTSLSDQKKKKIRLKKCL